MARRESTPNRRASEAKDDVLRVRRRYSKNTKRKKKISDATKPHIENMVAVLHLAHYPNTQIARIVGISRNQVAEMLQEPGVMEMIVTLRQEIPEAALDLMEAYMIEAVQAIVDVMRVSEDDAVVLKAASEILDRTGLPKTTKQERHQTNEERTTITDDGIVEALREASPEVQEAAATLIEQLEGLLKTAATTEGGDDES